MSDRLHADRPTYTPRRSFRLSEQVMGQLRRVAEALARRDGRACTLTDAVVWAIGRADAELAPPEPPRKKAQRSVS